MNIAAGDSRSNSLESVDTHITTPENAGDSGEDVWASDGEDERLDSDGIRQVRRPQELLSDLPTMRRQHMTDGYREGLSVGKGQVMQQGFDEGYPIGIRIALRVGKVLGVLEGCLAAKQSSSETEEKTALQKLYEQAKAELAITALLKETNDQIIFDAEDVPPQCVQILEKWESRVFDPVQETKQTTNTQLAGVKEDMTTKTPLDQTF